MRLSVVIAHPVLYELECRGHKNRIRYRSELAQLGTALTVHLVGVIVSVALLALFNHVTGTDPVNGFNRLSFWVHRVC